jgi:hypothetical protein
MQARYALALSKIAAASPSGAVKKHTPIFQGEPAITHKQAIQEAADALFVLSKIRGPVNTSLGDFDGLS